MATRQIIQLEGLIDNPNLPSLDISTSEIEVANIPGLTFWAATQHWAVESTGTGFVDRMDGPSIPANGSSSVNTRIVEGQNEKSFYSPVLVNECLRIPVDLSTSWTLGLGFARTETGGPDIRVGHITTATSPREAWYLSGNNEGKFRFGFGALSTGFSAYTGPLLTGTNVLALVIIYDRESSTVKLRVNKQDTVSITNALINTYQYPAEISMGAYNVTGTVNMVAGRYLSPIFFNKVLSLQDLNSFENMLMEACGN